MARRSPTKSSTTHKTRFLCYNTTVFPATCCVEHRLKTLNVAVTDKNASTTDQGQFVELVTKMPFDHGDYFVRSRKAQSNLIEAYCMPKQNQQITFLSQNVHFFLDTPEKPSIAHRANHPLPLWKASLGAVSSFVIASVGQSSHALQPQQPAQGLPQMPKVKQTPQQPTQPTVQVKQQATQVQQTPQQSQSQEQTVQLTVQQASQEQAAQPIQMSAEAVVALCTAVVLSGCLALLHRSMS